MAESAERVIEIEEFGPKAGATALCVATAAGALYLEPTWSLWGDGFARATSLALGLGVVTTLAAVFRGGPFARRCVATGLLVAVAGFLVARLGGYQARASVWPDLRYVVALFALVSTAAVGLMYRKRWARWLALSLAFAGASSAAINLAALRFSPSWFSWLLGVFTIGGALVIVNLIGSRMAASDAVDAHDFSQAWPATVRPVWWLRTAVISALVAAPMLVLYAWVQHGTLPTFETPAVLLALAMTVSTVLVVRGRAIGALLLGGSGSALVVFCVLLVGAADFAHERDIAIYYLVFWLPAGLAATICGTYLARAAFRLTAELED